MKKIVYFICGWLMIHVYQAEESTAPTRILYHQVLNDRRNYPELIVENTPVSYTPEGMEINGKGSLFRLDKYYSLGERMIRCHVKFGKAAVALFQCNSGDFKVSIHSSDQSVTIEPNPHTWKKMNFLDPGHEDLIEIYRAYQTQTVQATDVYTGESDKIELTTDGTG